MFDYVHSPTLHAKYDGSQKWGSGGHMGEVVPSRDFLIFLGSFNASTTYTLISVHGFSLSAFKNVFRWWVCSFGVGLPGGVKTFPFLPQTPSHLVRSHPWSRIRLSDRLRRLNLPSLELRRLYTDLIYCYKIVFGLTDLPLSDYFQMAPLS